jgi:endonuclease I
VTDGERARNDAVQQVQGNRNPFVDRPEFVDKVQFGTLNLGRG